MAKELLEKVKQLVRARVRAEVEPGTVFVVHVDHNASRCRGSAVCTCWPVVTATNIGKVSEAAL